MSSVPPSPGAASPGEFWDERFVQTAYVYGTEPNAFLVRQRHRLEPGMDVLAVADGEGRNGVWLAQQGMKVQSVDASAEGVKKALKLAYNRGVSIKTAVADLTEWDWPQGAYDAIVLVFLHLPPDIRPAIHHKLCDALKPGGLLLMEVFRPEQLEHQSGGPKAPEMLYSADLLRQDFAALDILELTEAAPELDEGPFHQGPAATLQMVAQRPMGAER